MGDTLHLLALAVMRLEWRVLVLSMTIGLIGTALLVIAWAVNRRLDRLERDRG